LFRAACNAASRDCCAACADEESSEATDLEAEASDCEIIEALEDDKAETGRAVWTTTNVGCRTSPPSIVCVDGIICQ